MAIRVTMMVKNTEVLFEEVHRLFVLSDNLSDYDREERQDIQRNFSAGYRMMAEVRR